jgi:hypothetical protein
MSRHCQRRAGPPRTAYFIEPSHLQSVCLSVYLSSQQAGRAVIKWSQESGSVESVCVFVCLCARLLACVCVSLRQACTQRAPNPADPSLSTSEAERVCLPSRALDLREDWTRRIEALVRLEGLAKGGAAAFDGFFDALRLLKDQLTDQLNDRSEAALE